MIHNTYFYGFVAIIAFDYLTGVMKSILWKVTDSNARMKGLVKHTLVLLAVALIWLFCDTYNVTPLAFAISGMYAANYAISILENFAIMGIYQPKFLKTKIESELRKYEKQVSEGLSLKDLEGRSKKVSVTIDNSSIISALKDAGIIRDDMSVGEARSVIEAAQAVARNPDETAGGN